MNATIKYNGDLRMYILEIGKGLLCFHHEHMEKILANWGLVSYLKPVYTRNIYKLGYNDGTLVIIDDDGNMLELDKFEFQNFVKGATVY